MKMRTAEKGFHISRKMQTAIYDNMYKFYSAIHFAILLY